MKTWFKNIYLEGDSVKLELLGQNHSEGLTEAVKDGKLWELWYTSAPHPTEVQTYIERALYEYEHHLSYPFVVIRKEDDKIAGTTRFMNMDSQNKRLEIGTTWYSKSVQRTNVNTECKFLLLQYAFETLGCIAVEFRTHHENIRSQQAIERLGAKLDGILRHHKFDKKKNLRNTYVYSILKSEWPGVKEFLISKLDKTY